MMRKALLVVALMGLVVGVVGAGGTEAARAEPGKNRIEAAASCSDGEDYAFVLNGMGKAWQLEGTNGNLIVKAYTLTYYEPGSDPATAEPIGVASYGRNAKKGPDDLITCEGEVTTVLEGVGPVRVVAEFESFVTPRRGG